MLHEWCVRYVNTLCQPVVRRKKCNLTFKNFKMIISVKNAHWHRTKSHGKIWISLKNFAGLNLKWAMIINFAPIIILIFTLSFTKLVKVRNSFFLFVSIRERIPFEIESCSLKNKIIFYLICVSKFQCFDSKLYVKSIKICCFNFSILLQFIKQISIYPKF